MQERRDAIYRKSLDCVHCGLCLPSCPTYRETGLEISSPRGRVYLMRGLAEGKVPMAEPLAEEAYLCLGCRACETACPSGVAFGSMVELLRAEVEEAGLREGAAKRIERFTLREVLPRPRLLRALVGLLGFAQRLGLDRLLGPLLPAGLREAQATLPPIAPRGERGRAPEVTPAQGTRRGCVAHFEGCVMPELFGPVNAATVRVLSRNGFEVRSPKGQGCCGALHAHAGDDAFARDLARRNLAAFDGEDLDAVVVNSAGCGAAMRDAAEWLPGEGETLAARVRDVCEWLDAEGLAAPLAPIDARVCYDDPCHLVHGQRVQEAPRRLLAAIPGITLVAHDEPGACCGAAGIYSLTHREMSQAVLDRKLDSLEAADPDVIATGNPGCLMQLRAGVAARGLRARVVHPIELIDESQRKAGEAAG